MLAWRNIWRNRKRTLVTLSSIGFGFALAVFFIGLGDGSHNSMIRNAIKLGDGHISVQGKGYLEAPANYKYLEQGSELLKELKALELNAELAPRISLQVLASSATNSVGLGFEGLASANDPRFEDISEKIIEGDSDIFSSERSVLIGEKLARKLKVDVGGKIVLMAGKKGGDSQAQLARVKGVFKTGLDEVDSYFVIGNLRLASLFLEGEGADLKSMPLTRIAIFLENEREQNQAYSLIKSSLLSKPSFENVAVLDWQTMMPQLVQFILVDDAGNYIFLALILIMVAVGVVNTVLMSVLERTREFGLLRALGISRNYLIVLVFLETLMLSFMSVLVGWFIGGPVHFWFAKNGLDISSLMSENMQMAGTYMDTIIYTELSFDRVFQLTFIIFFITLVTGIYPAIKAGRVTPIEALKA
jgi:ABC-type lipoprotein release transport system permease subunit